MLTFVMSGFLKGGHILTLYYYYDEETNSNIIRNDATHDSWNRRVFTTDQCRPDNMARDRNGIISTDTNDDSEGWLGRHLLLFRLEVPRCAVPQEVAIIKYMASIQPLETIDTMLGCVWF